MDTTRQSEFGHIHPVYLLCLVWLGYLGVLYILQSLGLPFGFHVWPLGEDHNWIGFMMDANWSKKMVHGFWSMNDRNPLSAWWWYAISPFQKHHAYAIYYARKCIDLFLAVTTFLLLDQLGRHKSKTYALCVALVVLTWNFSGYYEQIIWEFLGALGVSLLSIYFYCRYVDHGRANGHELAISLICYLVAIATYTLQSGAIIAIAGIAFFRYDHHPKANRLKTRIIHTSRDVSLYAAVFLIYSGIWYTTMHNAGEVYYTFNWTLLGKQLLSSLQQFFYHPVYSLFWRLAWNDWSKTTICLIVGITFALFIGVLFKQTDRKLANSNSILGWSALTLAAIALPTLLVEATSHLWVPGMRSSMVQQVWQPLLYVGAIFLVVRLLPMNNPEFKRTIALTLVALLGSITVLFGLNYNYHLVMKTHYQEILTKGIRDLNIPFDKLPHLLLKYSDPENIDMNSVSILVPDYAQTMLRRRDFSLRPFASHFMNSESWITKFGSDEKGVVNALPYPDTQAVPYKNLLIVYFDGTTVFVPKEINKTDLVGLQVEWNRNKPISQSQQYKLLGK